MPIKVRFFARLKDEIGKSEDMVPYEPGACVLDVWKEATGRPAMPESLLVAVNMEYARGNVELRDGDEVGFFPPVTGG